MNVRERDPFESLNFSSSAEGLDFFLGLGGALAPGLAVVVEGFVDEGSTTVSTTRFLVGGAGAGVSSGVASRLRFLSFFFFFAGADGGGAAGAGAFPFPLPLEEAKMASMSSALAIEGEVRELAKKQKLPGKDGNA